MSVSRLTRVQFFVDLPDSERIAIPNRFKVRRISGSSTASRQAANRVSCTPSGLFGDVAVALFFGI